MIEVLNLTGKVVQAGNPNGEVVQEIDWYTLAAGTYLLRLPGGHAPLLAKIMIR